MTAESDLLNVVCTGKFSLGEAKKTFLQMVRSEQAAQHATKVLFDGRSLIGNPKLMETLYYSEFAAETVIAQGISASRQFA